MAPLPPLTVESPTRRPLVSTPSGQLSDARRSSFGKLPSVTSPNATRPRLGHDIDIAGDTLTSWITPTPAHHAHTAAQTAAILGSFKFFQDFDPAVQAKLPDIVSIVTKRAGTVLFRQGDPPGNCYVVLSGGVGIFVSSDEDDDENSPRAEFVGEDRRDSVMSGMGVRSRKASILDQVPGKRTFEGFSSYHASSNLGTLVSQIGPGALVGELALLNDQTRSASIKCLSESELLFIRRCDFDNVLKEEMVKKGDEKLSFLMRHMPGMRDVAVPKLGAKPHASYFFRKGCYQRGHQFLQEGVVTETSIFVLYKGSVEFRRSERALPGSSLPQVASMPSLTTSPKSTNAKNNTRFAATGSGWRSRSQAKLHNLSKEEDPDEVVNRLGVLLPGGVFGSLPIIAKEPFTVTVTSPMCEVFFCVGADTVKLPRKLLDTVRDYLAHTTAWRLQCHHRSQDFRRHRQEAKEHRKKMGDLMQQ